MANMIIRPAAGTGNKVIVQDQAGAAVMTTADAGAAIESNVTNNAGVATGTIASAVTFPAGHHLQTYWDSLSYSSNPSLDVTSEGDAMGSNLQVTITPKSTSNVLNVRCFIPDLYNHATNGRSLMSGFRYSTASNFSSSVQLGERQYPSSHELYNSAGSAMLGNLSY